MDILCVGQLVTDILAKPIESIDYTVDTIRVESINVKNGGDCLNTAICLAKLGNDTGVIGKVGNDLFGNFLLEAIKSNGIDARGMIVEEGASTSSVIVSINNDGARVFFYYGGTNDTFMYEDLNTALIDECRIVHVGGTYSLPQFDGNGAAKLFAYAKAKGRLTSMDVTWDTSGRWLSTIKPCLKYLDIFMPSINEARHITGRDKPEDIARFLQDQGVKTVVVKLGRDGCYVKASDKGFFCPAYDVEVVDTTGAGDSFVAGFLTGVLKGWDLEKCARFASAVSAHCIQHIGATTGIPEFEDIIEFINRRIVD